MLALDEMTVVVDMDKGKEYAIVEEYRDRQECEDKANEYEGGFCVKGEDGQYYALAKVYTMKTTMEHGRVER
jgi:hypothetical protein